MKIEEKYIKFIFVEPIIIALLLQCVKQERPKMRVSSEQWAVSSVLCQALSGLTDYI